MQGIEQMLIQEILNEVIENILPKDSTEIIQNFVGTEILAIPEVERKLSETSGVSSGFEDSFSKTTSEDVEMKQSTPENESIISSDEYLNDTIDKAIDKFEFEENFREASVQTSPIGINKECQCELIGKTDQQANKKMEVKSTSVYCNNFNWMAETTAQKENKSFEGMEVSERIYSFPKQTPRIRLGLSKRARLQPLHT